MIELSLKKRLVDSSGEFLLDVAFNIEKGKFVTLYGNSGAGKTSIIRMIAGIFNPDEGYIKVDNDIWMDTKKGKFVKPQNRNIGLVFQDYALFPNMTVKENLSFSLNKGDDKSKIDELIEIMDLGNLQSRKPETLSGGQKQRVALARALVRKPKILMLDEPLSALDFEMRSKLQQYLIKVHKEFNLTTILISHDISEIVKMSDHILQIDHGKIINEGTPSQVFTHNEVSGKFQFTGEVMAVQKQDCIFIFTVLIGKELVKVVAEANESKDIGIGDKVLIASKAFNPIIHKIS